MLYMSALWFCLVLVPMHQCIKIGISHNYNTTTSTTAITEISATEIPTTNIILDLNYTGSPLPEIASTPSQTFPPRKTLKTSKTTAAPETITAATVATIAPAKPPQIVPPFRNKRFNYCACDLHSDVCELNCCCDHDCPTEALQVFSCLQSTKEKELKARLEDFQYNHGLPACQLNDGWLCVFRSNSKPPKMQTTINSFNSEQYNKWPEQLDAFESPLESASQFMAHYKYGEALQLWQPETKQLSHLELPIGYESSSCQLKQTLLHLQPMRSNCLMSNVTQLQMHMWTLLNLTNSHQLLSKPRDPEDQELQGINIQVCRQLLMNSSYLCLDANDNDVNFLVDSIELELLHNYTHILAAKMVLKEACQLEEDEEIWLSYQLNFKLLNQTKSQPSSGPLGYVQGAPMLLSNLIILNNSEALLSYFQSNASDDQGQHWLTPCSLHNSAPLQPVNFGEDLSKRCQISQLSPMQHEHDNHTNNCQQLQSYIFSKLLPHNCTQLDDLHMIYVSQLGRPQPQKWLPLQLSYADGGQQLTPIQGIYDEQQQSLSCRNMLLSVTYEFFVTDLPLLDEGYVPHQSVLQHAKLVMGQRHDLEFDAREQIVKLPLAVTVRFFKAHDRRFNGSNSVTMGNYGLILITLLMSMIILEDKNVLHF